MNGALVVDKPRGPSSHDVVAVVRRATGVSRIGHTGTLDPLATGVLALVVGRATRLAQFLSGDDKTYEADIRLGLATDTYDITGAPVPAGPVAGAPDRAAIERELDSFRGTFEQTPPPFSAKKIQGVRSYALARRQTPVVPPPVQVTVRSLELLEWSTDRVRLRLTCSAGFYVRSLAHALGERLGVGGCLEALRRTRSGGFAIEDAVPLAWIVEARQKALERLVPMARLLPELQGVTLTPAGIRRAAHGNAVAPEHVVGAVGDLGRPGTLVRLLDADGGLLGVARAGREPGTLRPAVVLV